MAQLRAAGCVYAEDEAAVICSTTTDPIQLESMVRRRVAGEPLEYVVGWAEFCGLRLQVARGVFVPRRRSEFLAACAIELAGPGQVVLDLCCGVGALAAALDAAVDGLELHVADVDPFATTCACHNVPRARVHTGDLYSALPAELAGRVDLLVVNAPYVPTGEIRLMPPEARDHERRAALDGGADGLELHRRVAAGAAPWLAQGAHLLIETSARQVAGTAGILAAAGFRTSVRRDEELEATVVVASRG